MFTLASATTSSITLRIRTGLRAPFTNGYVSTPTPQTEERASNNVDE